MTQAFLENLKGKTRVQSEVGAETRDNLWFVHHQATADISLPVKVKPRTHHDQGEIFEAGRGIL